MIFRAHARSKRRFLAGVAGVLVMTVLAPAAGFAGTGVRAHVDGSVLLRAREAHGAPLHVIVTGSRLERAAALVHARVERKLPSLGGISLTLDADKLQALANAPGVRNVSLDRRVVPDGSSGGTTFANLATTYPLIDGADVGWKRGLTGAGIGIAIIDSGTTPVADFGARLVQVRLPAQKGSLDDAVGHGSLVAGVAAGNSAAGDYIGVAPGANVFAVNVARPDGLYSSDVIDGIQWVLKNHQKNNIRVAVLSLSETTASSYLTDQLDAAVEKLWNDGVVVVASSGNAGPGRATVAPGNDPYVLTVGATDTGGTIDTSDDVIAPFTSTGPTTDGFRKPELLAPGRQIVSVLAPNSLYARVAPIGNLVGSGYLRISGTSFSAPQVAGAAALLLQQNPGWSPDQIKYILVSTARPVSGSPAPALDLGKAFTGNPGGVRQQTFAGSKATGGGGTIATWDSSSWNSSSWNSSSWNSSSWNSSSWNSSSWN
jgi:serine protease AprX